MDWGNIGMFPASASDLEKMHRRLGLMEDLSRFSMMSLIPSGPHALCSSSSVISQVFC